MKIEDMRARLDEVRSELLELGEADEVTTEDAERFEALTGEHDELTESIRKAEERASKLDAIRKAAEDDANRERAVVDLEEARTVNISTKRGASDPFDRTTLPKDFGREAEARSRALDVVEKSSRFVSDLHREQATRVIERAHGRGAGENVLMRSRPEYADGFLKVMMGEQHRLSQAEQRALDEVRAMALSDVTGVLVPSHLDPTVILSNDGSVNPFRRACRVESGTTNVFTSVTSAGITASWDAEANEVSDDAPSFSNPTATAYKGQAFVPISFEAYEDARGREGDIVRMIVDAKDRLEATAFATGNGTSQPRGLVTALDANTNVELETATSNSFAVGDVYSTYENLPARWRPNAAWFANLAIVQDIRQFGTNALNTQTVDLTADGNFAILGKPVYEASAMDGTVAAGGEDSILIVGDPGQYLIYDRLGVSVEFIPNLFATGNNRPSGQRGWLSHWRTGANTTVDTAFRLLQAHTNS